MKQPSKRPGAPTRKSATPTMPDALARRLWSINVKKRDPSAWSEPSLAGLGCSCCVLANTPILLADGSTRFIELFKGGEIVRTLTGTARVEKLEIVHLGLTRRVIELVGPDGESLYATDDHPLWTRVGDGEWWGTYNFSHYLFEKQAGGGSFLKRDAVPLRFDQPNEHAHVEGWHRVQPLYHQAPPETPVFHLALDEGGSYIAGGFVLISHCHDEDVAGAQWRGLRAMAAELADI